MSPRRFRHQREPHHWEAEAAKIVGVQTLGILYGTCLHSTYTCLLAG